MVKCITRRQEDELYDAMGLDTQEFNRLLNEYAGIEARPCVAYAYYDAAGNYIADSGFDDFGELLAGAGIEVVEEGELD